MVANANIRSDIERWKINKEKDCRSLLADVADAHLEFYRESATNWESLIQFIDSADNDV